MGNYLVITTYTAACDGILRGDFHTHMNGNGIDNRWANVQSLCVAAKSLGFNALYLGCHDFVCPKDLASRATDTFGLIIVRGAEITTDGGHLLAYNIAEVPWEIHADNKHPVDVFHAVHVIHAIGGKAVMAHPYPVDKHFSWPNRFREVVDLLDGAEIANHKSMIRDSIQEFDHVRQWSHLKLFRGSDCHPWEGDALDYKFHTDVPLEWFGKLV